MASSLVSPELPGGAADLLLSNKTITSVTCLRSTPLLQSHKEVSFTVRKLIWTSKGFDQLEICLKALKLQPPSSQRRQQLKQRNIFRCLTLIRGFLGEVTSLWSSGQLQGASHAIDTLSCTLSPKTNGGVIKLRTKMIAK